MDQEVFENADFKSAFLKKLDIVTTKKTLQEFIEIQKQEIKQTVANFLSFHEKIVLENQNKNTSCFNELEEINAELFDSNFKLLPLRMKPLIELSQNYEADKNHFLINPLLSRILFETLLKDITNFTSNFKKVIQYFTPIKQNFIAIDYFNSKIFPLTTSFYCQNGTIFNQKEFHSDVYNDLFCILKHDSFVKSISGSSQYHYKEYKNGSISEYIFGTNLITREVKQNKIAIVNIPEFNLKKFISSVSSEIESSTHISELYTMFSMYFTLLKDFFFEQKMTAIKNYELSDKEVIVFFNSSLPNGHNLTTTQISDTLSEAIIPDNFNYSDVCELIKKNVKFVFISEANKFSISYFIKKVTQTCNNFNVEDHQAIFNNSDNESIQSLSDIIEDALNQLHNISSYELFLCSDTEINPLKPEIINLSLEHCKDIP